MGVVGGEWALGCVGCEGWVGWGWWGGGQVGGRGGWVGGDRETCGVGAVGGQVSGWSAATAHAPCG